MHENPVRYWHSLTTGEVEALALCDPVVILPLAAVEQHGAHLPLSTDFEIGMGLLATAFRHLPAELPAWVLPPQSLGSSMEHARLAGTLSLDPDTLTALIFDVGSSLAACGVRRMVLSNSHGGNRGVLDDAGLRLREEHDMLVVKASYFRFSRPEDVELPDAEWRHGLHGGAVETAMMLHLRPDLVRTDEISDTPSLGEELEATLSRLSPEGEASFSWLAQDLSPSGVTGDARLADDAMGERLVAHYGQVLAEVIRDTKDFPLNRLG